jgi:hypothetical protein
MDEEMAYQGDPGMGGDMGQDAGAGGIDPQIVQGVQAFMETQDPQIAVEVVMMIAELLGLQQPQQSPEMMAPEGQQQMGMPPMGRRGMRVPSYGKGGKLSAMDKYKAFKSK